MPTTSLGGGASRPLAQTVVIIPVAAHQESRHVAHTMSEYARQETRTPFTIVLGLNSPTAEANSAGVQATLAAVEAAREAHPNLDIRSTFIAYDDPIIGTIRRDLWNGVALASREAGNFNGVAEVVGVNHDIDLIKLARGCIGRIQLEYERRQQPDVIAAVSRVYATRVKHANSPAHPHISAAVRWSDFVHRQAGTAFEAGMVIPMSFYARRGGFTESARTHEVGSLTARSIFGTEMLRGTNTETSSRRYIARMERQGYRIWEDGDFTAQDECRERDDYPDIKRDRMLEIVGGSLESYAELLRKSTVDTALETYRVEGHMARGRTLSDRDQYDAICQFIEQRLAKVGALSRFVLDRTAQSDQLVDKFTGFFAPEILSAYVKEYFGGDDEPLF